MSDRTRLVRVNFFHAEGDQYSTKQQSVNRSKTYDYYMFGDEPLAEGDVVIVRTYNDDNGPLRFAKVASIHEGDWSWNNARRPIICRLPLERIEEQRKKLENLQRAKNLLKEAEKNRSTADLFSQVSDQLSETDRAFVAETLGFTFDKPLHNGKSLMTLEFFYNGQTLKVLSPDMEAAKHAAATHFNVLPSLLTYRLL